MSSMSISEKPVFSTPLRAWLQEEEVVAARVGKRLQEDAVDDAEDRGVGADAERDRDDHGQRVAGLRAGCGRRSGGPGRTCRRVARPGGEDVGGDALEAAEEVPRLAPRVRGARPGAGPPPSACRGGSSSASSSRSKEARRKTCARASGRWDVRAVSPQGMLGGHCSGSGASSHGGGRARPLLALLGELALAERVSR